MNLSEIRKIAAERWKFDAANYPDLARLVSDASFTRFKNGHILKHIVKSVGKIAELEESHDHQKEYRLNGKAMRVLIGKMLINLMQLAESYGVSDKELEEYIREEGAKPT